MNFKSDRGSPSCFSAWPFPRSRSTAHPINGNIGNISRPGTASFNIELIANKRTRRGRGNLITVIPFFDHRYPVYRLRRPSEALCNFSLTSRTISKKKKKEKTAWLSFVIDRKFFDATLCILDRGSFERRRRRR